MEPKLVTIAGRDYVDMGDGRLFPMVCGGGPVPVTPPVSPPPPAIPGAKAAAPGALPGSVWVESSELHYIASDGTHWGGTGTATPGGPGIPGSFWIDPSGNATYVDQPGQARILQVPAGTGGQTGIEGSVWVESGNPTGRQLSYIGNVSVKFFWWNGS